MSDRTPFTNFGLPVPELRRGYYTAVYFWREKRILERERNERRALMQVFNKVDGATVCGVDETLAMLRLATGFWRDYEAMYPLFDRYIEVKQARWKANSEHRWEDVIELTTESCDLQRRLEDLWCDTHSDLTIHALREGDVSRSFEAVVTIEGRASDFAHLESVYLGVLARGTKVATRSIANVSSTPHTVHPLPTSDCRFPNCGEDITPQSTSGVKKGSWNVSGTREGP